MITSNRAGGCDRTETGTVEAREIAPHWRRCRRLDRESPLAEFQSRLQALDPASEALLLSPMLQDAALRELALAEADGY